MRGGIHSVAAAGDANELKKMIKMIPPSLRSKRLDAFNRYGFTPLHSAIFHDHCDVVEVLLSFGADATLPAHRNQFTYSLHLAAIRCGAKMIRLLLNSGADPFLFDWDGLTPKQIAIMSGNRPVVGILKQQMEARKAHHVSMLPEWSSFGGDVQDGWWRVRHVVWPEGGDECPLIADHYSDGGAPAAEVLKHHIEHNPVFYKRLYRVTSQPLTRTEKSLQVDLVDLTL
jgi:hypothetical protein